MDKLNPNIFELMKYGLLTFTTGSLMILSAPTFAAKVTGTVTININNALIKQLSTDLNGWYYEGLTFDKFYDCSYTGGITIRTPSSTGTSIAVSSSNEDFIFPINTNTTVIKIPNAQSAQESEDFKVDDRSKQPTTMDVDNTSNNQIGLCGGFRFIGKHKTTDKDNKEVIETTYNNPSDFYLKKIGGVWNLVSNDHNFNDNTLFQLTNVSETLSTNGQLSGDLIFGNGTNASGPVGGYGGWLGIDIANNGQTIVGHLSLIPLARPETEASVTNVSPLTAVINTKTSFTISGKNFTNETAFTLASASCVKSSFTATTLKVDCTATESGEKAYSVIKEAGGFQVSGSAAGGFIKITDSKTQTVTKVEPLTAIIGTDTSITITGANLTQDTFFELANATCTKGAFTTTSLKYTCKATTEGEHNYSVKVGAASDAAVAGGASATGKITFEKTATSQKPLAPSISVTPSEGAQEGTAMAVIFTPVSDITYKLCYGSASGDYSTGCIDTASPFTFTMPAGFNAYAAVKAIKGTEESTFSNELHIRTVGENATYNLDTLTLTIQDVKVGDQHFNAILNYEDDHFVLKSADTLKSAAHNEPVEYGETTKTLTLPRVLAGDKLYKAVLLNIGDSKFELKSVDELAK